jgi:cell division protein FtsI/penicillin-binding protein 2
MLVDVVENGHGKKAGVKGYFIGGKTGTAQVAATDKSGYDPNKNIGSFIGFGPVDKPAFLMLVRIDNPRDVKFAESTAAPAFGEMASFILNYLQIPPTR